MTLTSTPTKVLSKLPIEEQRVLRFRKWWGRGARAAVLVKVVPRKHANGLPLWFGATSQPALAGRTELGTVDITV